MFIVELTMVAERTKRSFEEGIKSCMLWNCEKKWNKRKNNSFRGEQISIFHP